MRDGGIRASRCCSCSGSRSSVLGLANGGPLGLTIAATGAAPRLTLPATGLTIIATGSRTTHRLTIPATSRPPPARVTRVEKAPIVRRCGAMLRFAAGRTIVSVHADGGNRGRVARRRAPDTAGVGAPRAVGGGHRLERLRWSYHASPRACGEPDDQRQLAIGRVAAEGR